MVEYGARKNKKLSKAKLAVFEKQHVILSPSQMETVSQRFDDITRLSASIKNLESRIEDVKVELDAREKVMLPRAGRTHIDAALTADKNYRETESTYSTCLLRLAALNKDLFSARQCIYKILKAKGFATKMNKK